MARKHQILSHLGGVGGMLEDRGRIIEFVQTPDLTLADPATWTVAAHALFTATGRVLVHALFAVVDTLIVSTSNNGVIEIGVASDTDILLGQLTAGAGTLAAGDILSGSPTAGHLAAAGVIDNTPVALEDIDIDLKVSTNAVTAGQMTVYAIWEPISDDGDLVAATWD